LLLGADFGTGCILMKRLLTRFIRWRIYKDVVNRGVTTVIKTKYY